MKRADDLRRFLEKGRTLADSLDALPELPDGCGIPFLEDVARTVPIADSPYARSDLRDGLKVWDAAYLPFPASVSVVPKERKDIATLRGTNAFWEKTKESLGMVGRPDGVHYLRPKGPCILDLMNDDLRLLQGAHVMTHRQALPLAEDDYTFGETSDVFLRNLVKLFAARTYGLRVNVHPDVAADDAFSLYGIEVFGSSELRAPVLQAAASGDRCRLVRDGTVVCLLGSVGIEAPPKNAAKDTAWRETNKWSCLPTLAALAGWECVDYVTHAERTEIRGDPYYAVPCGDLRGMDEFGEVIEMARAERGEPAASPYVFGIDEWFGSEDFRSGLGVTPQLPCPHCLRIARGASGAVARPVARKPNKPFKEIAESQYRDTKAWADYVRYMRNCVEIGRTATAYALGSVTSVRRRNAAFRKRTEKLRRLRSLSERYVRKRNGGYLSEAEAILSEIEKIKKEIK